MSLLLTFATGASGLVYEVAWQRYLATLLGSHSEATAAVLALFLGGLSVGYSLFGRLTRRMVEDARRRAGHPRLLLAYGLIEGAIGVWALAFPWLFQGVQAVSSWVPHGTTGVGFAFDVLLATLLIGPPSVLMGGTIPILTQALSRGLEDATRFHALVYAFNTLGAFLGAISAGFFLVPWLGLVTLMYAVGAVNLTAGSLFVLLGLRARPLAPGLDAPVDAARLPYFAAYAAIALLVGFAMMALQTALIRVAGLAIGSSPFTFSMVVAVFVLCIAIGSLAVSLAPGVGWRTLLANQVILAAFAAGLYLLVPYSPWGAHLLRGVFRDVDAAFYPFWLSALAVLLAMIGPVAILSGASLPLLFHHLRRQSGELGAVAGALYSWNTIGSLLGALLGGYALLFFLDLHHVYRIGVAALVIAAGIVGVLLLPRLRPIVGVVTAASLIGLALLAPWDPKWMSAGLFRTREIAPLALTGNPRHFLDVRMNKGKLLFYDDDPVSTVTITEFDPPGRTLSRSIANNGKSDGNTDADYPTMGLIAMISALLADKTDNAFVIGYGTGVSVGELAALENVKKVTVAEISPAVIRGAPLFDAFNLRASENPKVKVVVSDAYRAMLRGDETYDLIVSEPSNPWVAGVEMVYTKEFLEAARDRLAPGGVYAQWIHLYENDTRALELVLRTYDAVFDSTAVWSTMQTDLLILGLKDGPTALDVARITERAKRPDFTAGLRRAKVASVPALLAHEILPQGVLRALQLRGPMHTLLHPRLTDLAGRGFFRGARAVLPFSGFGGAAQAGRENSLLQRWIAANGKGALTEDVREQVAEQACTNEWTLCIPWLAAWRAAAPGSKDVARYVEGIGRSPLLKEDPTDVLDAMQKLMLDDAPPGTTPIARARLANRLYYRYYSHGAPFSPDRLEALWKRCTAKNAGVCTEGRRRTQKLVQQGVGERLEEHAQAQ
ncbi:MAG TPA: fused MFS/spermidine synthase [Myxococcota bacterium]|nr:fused MFS/spermidine synthase [Myxococcota bacterium]